MMESVEYPFGNLPAELLKEVLKHTEKVSNEFIDDFTEVDEHRKEWRKSLVDSGLIREDTQLDTDTIPTTCGVDGSYAVERLLVSDLVIAGAVAVEGLTPPSETGYWPEPHHRVWFEKEIHQPETGTVLRGLTIGWELKLAAEAPHQVILLDGSLTTPFINFNQALNKINDVPNLKTTKRFLEEVSSMLEAYLKILDSTQADRFWLAIPKYTSKREIETEMRWHTRLDDRSLFSILLKPGEYTTPKPLEQPDKPWHLNLKPLESTQINRIKEKIIAALEQIQVVYYRPYPFLPAFRIEMSHAVGKDQKRLATALTGIRHQLGKGPIQEPYPLYLADRMAKELPKAIPALRQITGQQIAAKYYKEKKGKIDEIFQLLQSYRTEQGT